MGFEETKAELVASPRKWVVTGVAGFIGSNLLETLLRLNQRVVGLDNLSTGHAENLEQVEAAVGPSHWRNFTWIEGDIQEPPTCRQAVDGADYVLHEAAIGSVPRSVANPAETNASNVTGFVNMIWASRESGVKRFVFASSSSVYGDVQALPQMEENIGNCLSPYAVSKRVNELYADVFGRCYGMETIGLRYFNVFGPRQDPDGPYAAVIPKWISALIKGEPIFINGDGSTSRDFCYVANVVQANILAATADKQAINTIYNIALGDETSLINLFVLLRDRLQDAYPHLRGLNPEHRPFQQGDVRFSRADITKARRLLDYIPSHKIEHGLDEALDWYIEMYDKSKVRNPSQPISPVL